MKTKTILLSVIVCILLMPSSAFSATGNQACVVYFTGIGCPHCAKADPVVLQDLFDENPDLVVIEYEVYQERGNAPLMYDYDESYGSGLKIPLMIFPDGNALLGDMTIIQEASPHISLSATRGCPLSDGSIEAFGDLDLSGLPGSPKIWTKDRLLIPDPSQDAGLLKDLLISGDLGSVFSSGEFSLSDETSAPLSGGQIAFQHAVDFGSSRFLWNGDCPAFLIESNGSCEDNGDYGYDSPRTLSEFTIAKILSLAAVDAVNPCALAVLTLMLIAILTYNPKIRKNVLLSGFAFTLSVFVMYIIYGLVIIRSFQLIQALTSIRIVLYNVLGAAAIVLGVLNLKDFFRYKPGGFMTEMPMRMRPTLKRIISGITSPRGAFVVGAFVTVFLLPCTIGPYVIAGGILSSFELLQTLPWLAIYNLVFVLPMIAITLMVYFGTAKVEDVSGWKDKNIRYLHLFAGAIIIVLGISMIMGWL